MEENKKVNSLTLRQATDQGYTHYGYGDVGWQHAQEIHDDLFKDEAEHNHDNLYLFSKKSNTPSITAKVIAELLSDHIGDEDGRECMRDDDVVYKTVQKIDFTETANKINQELEQHRYWMLTDIKLTHH